VQGELEGAEDAAAAGAAASPTAQRPTP